jgi:predicted oxidoreductase
MKTNLIGSSAMKATRMAYGCWRLADVAEGAGATAAIAAYEAGFTLFDHADIYGDSQCETIFGGVLKEVSGMREGIVIASKCGIRKPGDPAPDSPYRYDFSAEYIIQSCEQSLERLGVDVIEIFQLHRPDYLCDPHEVAGAFEKLQADGKVREFGVSNFNPSQLAMLQKACPMPLIVNQVEISLANLACFDDGTLDHCLTEKITPLAWSPLGGGKLADGPVQLLGHQEGYDTSSVVSELDKIAAARGSSRTAIALAWLMRHPSGIVPIVGTTNPERINEAATADDIELTRDEWYRLMGAARQRPLP